MTRGVEIPLLRGLPAVMGAGPATKRERTMRHRTLTLLATPAVLGAMTVAVPALAGVGSGPAAHSASSRCFIAHVAKHRVRECLLRGPRGFTGPAGPRGFTGATGKTGKTGKTGPAGKNGTNGVNGTNGSQGLQGVP